MLGGLFKRVVLAVAVAVVALTASESQAQVDGEPNMYVYSDAYVRIVIVGEWGSASETNKTVTFFYPAEDRVRVTCECTQRGWEAVSSKVDDRVNGGFVELKVKCLYNSEATHEVKLKFRTIGKIDFDLDCDADWDGDIDDDDDPIEDLTGALVGVHKLAPIELKLDYGDADPTNCTENGTVSIELKGGISLCSTNGGVVKVIVEAPQKAKEPVKKELTLQEAGEITSVRGEEVSGKFADCEVKATLNLPGGISAEDVVRYTVVDVDIIIDGKSEPEETEEGAYALFVNDFEETPYAPRATNYFKKVEIQIYPKDFPEDLQTNIWVDVTGNLDHLVEKVPMAATWGDAPYSPATNRYTLADLKKQDSAGDEPYFALHGHAWSEKLRDHRLVINEPKTTAEDIGLFTVVKLNVVPDYDRDHVIGKKDEEQLCMDKKFYWWNNDDYDSGDSANIFSDTGSDIHGGHESLRREIQERNARRRSEWVSSGGSFGGPPEDELEPQKQNCDDDIVNGRRDLLDFFPMWVDAFKALGLFKGVPGIGLRLEFPGFGIVDTDLETKSAGKFLYEKHSTADGKMALHEAYVDNFGTTTFTEKRSTGLFFSRTMEAFLQKIKESPKNGILMVEGSGGRDVTLHLTKKNAKTGEIEDVVSATTPMSARDVRDFYSEVSLYKEQPEIIRERETELDELFDEKKDVVSLHGFKVTAAKADGWHSEFFKRLYQSQSYARFWGITWNGAYDDGKWYHSAGQFYHRDAAYAFVTGKRLKVFLDENRGNKMKGEVSVMAHSLGNMVVSSAIALEGMGVNRYFMLDAAVPAEAYDGERDDVRMINYQWKDYPKKSFCSKWYQRFEGAPDVEEDGKKVRDARQDLKWPSLFSKINCAVYNYYSDGDEVFELRQDVEMGDGRKRRVGYDLSQYSWQKQEIGKGANMAFNLIIDESKELGISEHSGGWGFHLPRFWRDRWGIRDFLPAVYSAAQAKEASDEKLRKNPVFAHTPEKAYEWEKYDNEYTRTQKMGLLCHVVPAMSESAGHVEIAKKKNRNLNDDKDFKKGWGRSGWPYDQRWLHCDLKDMAYYFNFKAWNQIVADGNFMKENRQ